MQDLHDIVTLIRSHIALIVIEREAELRTVEETGTRIESRERSFEDAKDDVRAADPTHFPEVERFREMKRDGMLNSVEYVARELLAIAFDPARSPKEVALRLESEHESS